MSRQSRLVLLLLLSIGIAHLAHSTTENTHIIVHDDVADNQLDSDEILADEKQHIKISTPKQQQQQQKETSQPSTTAKAKSGGSATATTTTTERIISDSAFQDLLEASKHSEVLAKDERLQQLLAKKMNSTRSTPAPLDDTYDDDYDNYYDYEYGLNNNDQSTTSVSKKSKAKDKLAKKAIEMKPIKEDIKTSTSKLMLEDNKESNNIEFHDDNVITHDDDEDDEDDYDDEDDEDEDDEFDTDNDIKDEEEVIFSEDLPCPRYCSCVRNVNNYLVAYCSRIDPDQKFGKDITDLVVTDVGPKYPILLGPDFFLDLGLKHVSSIKIANCTIEYLHPDAFNGLDDLFSVNFTNVGLAIINPDTFAKNKKLRLLTISGNDLSVMSSVHYLLKSSSIEELDLSRNNLMELNPNAFSQLTNIVYINLSQNNLQKIPEGVFDSLDTIEELDLSYNSLKTLPPTLFNHTALAILHLKYNSITNDLKFGTPDLQQLDLSFNQIHTVHHGMFDKMTGLTNLNLKGNGLTKVQPDSFMTLKNLRNIDLSINELDQVSSMLFFKNSELDVIRLNDNPRLSQLPTDGFRSYNGYFTIYYLDVSNCAIGALGHKTFSTMPHLSILKLAWNNINNLDRDTFSSLKKLIDLDLSNNLIAKLDELIFMNNNDLTKLNLAGNPIHKLSVRLFLPLSKLRELDVSDCELKSLLADNQYGVGRKYKFYETLRSFNASSNQIHKIHSNDVRSFKNLRSLDIGHNPLKCNDDFQDFISYVSLNHQLMPHAMPLLANMGDSQQLEIESQAGWATLAHEVCKHEDMVRKKSLPSVNKFEKRLQKADKDLDEDAKNLFSIMEQNKLQKILKDTRQDESLKDDAAEDEEEENEKDAEETDYDDDDGDDDNDNDNEEDDDNADSKRDDYEDYEKKAEISKKIIDHGIRVQEIDLSKETSDRFLLDKFIADRKKHLQHNNNNNDEDSQEDDEDDNNDENDEEEYIIERGHIYYSGYRFLVPIIVIITCAVVLLLVIAKVVAMVMRKRGERYRMSLLQAHTNSIVYQKLTEDIKPPKEPKQPKVHQYTPINQV